MTQPALARGLATASSAALIVLSATPVFAQTTTTPTKIDAAGYRLDDRGRPSGLDRPSDHYAIRPRACPTAGPNACWASAQNIGIGPGADYLRGKLSLKAVGGGSEYARMLEKRSS